MIHEHRSARCCLGEGTRRVRSGVGHTNRRGEEGEEGGVEGRELHGFSGSSVQEFTKGMEMIMKKMDGNKMFVELLSR